MKKRSFKFMGMFAVLALLTACGDDNADKGAVTENSIVIDGSSTVFPITAEAASRYMRSDADADIRVSFSGSTAGFEAFCNGDSDVSNASRAINQQEIQQCAENAVDYMVLPVAMDAVAVVVHSDNDWVDSITIDELNTIWSQDSEDKVLYWNQVRSDWPDKTLSLYGRGQDSGTYDYFTKHVTGETRQSRHDYVASEDEEFLAEHIATDENAIAFFGIGVYHRHWDTLKLLAVDSGDGPVFPSLEMVKNGEYAPFSRPLYVYVNKASLAEKSDLKPFLQHYFANIQNWLHFTGYMPLAASQYQENILNLQ